MFTYITLRLLRVSPVNDGTGMQAVRCGYVENYLDAGGENASGNQKKVVVRTSLSLQVTKLVRLWLLLVRNSNLYIRYIEKGGSERSRLFVS